jgi:hypothetical protein
VQAARSPDPVTAARRYAALGLSVLPLRGKRPALRSWRCFQTAPPGRSTLDKWASAGLFQNVGVVCGEASGGLVVLDLDGRAAYLAFAARFPRLADTFTVTTGSGVGHHVYLRVEHIPRPIRALLASPGNVELRSTGQQVVAPPSIHPRTGRPYTLARPLEVLRVQALDDVAGWIAQLRRADRGSARRPRGSTYNQREGGQPAAINPALIEAIAAHFRRAGYRQNRAWLNGPCIYPERHAHDDRNPSFGFQVRSGTAFAFDAARCWPRTSPGGSVSIPPIMAACSCRRKCETERGIRRTALHG